MERWLSCHRQTGLRLSIATTHLLQITQLGLSQPPPASPIPGVESLCAVQGEAAAGEVVTPWCFFQRLIWNMVDRSPRSEASDIESPLWL